MIGYFLHCNDTEVKAEKLNVEVLIDGVDIEPNNKIIGSCGPFTRELNYGTIVWLLEV